MGLKLRELILKNKDNCNKNFGGRSQESNLPGTAGGPNWI